MSLQENSPRDLLDDHQTSMDDDSMENYSSDRDLAVYHSADDLDLDIYDLETSTKPSSQPASVKAYFISSGLISLSFYYIMLAESDHFHDLYPFGNYGFAVIVPQYFAMPLSILLSKIIQSVELKTKINVLIILCNTLFLCIPILVIILPKVPIAYGLIMLIYTLTYVLSITLQGSLIAVCSLYPEQYSVIFQICQPIFNIVATTIKLIIGRFDCTIYIDFFIIWGLYTLCNIYTLILLYIIANGPEFRSVDKSNDPNNAKKKEIDYTAAFKIVKSELILIFLTYSTTFYVFPGIFFKLNPPTLFTRKFYFNMITFLGAVFALLGKPTASMRYNEVSTKVLLILGILVNLFLYYCYFEDLYITHEGLSYLFLILVGFMLYRISAEGTFYIIKSRSLSTPATREAIGTLMSSTLIGGIAFGNIMQQITLWFFG